MKTDIPRRLALAAMARYLGIVPGLIRVSAWIGLAAFAVSRVAAQGPGISGFYPPVAAVGESVLISGTNFSPNLSNNIVFFGAVRAEVTAASLTNLNVTVPSGAVVASITVTVAGLTAAARLEFIPTFAGGNALASTSFEPRFNLGTGDGPTATVIADFDGDGKPDIAVTDDYGSTISIYRNVSIAGLLDSNSFAPRVVLPARTTGYSPYMLVAGDVDGDGRLDLVASDVDGSSVSVFRNQAAPGSLDSNSFAPFVSFSVAATPRGVALADLDGDGRPEILTANYDTGTVTVLRNDCSPGQIAATNFANRFELTAEGGTHGVAVADLDGDGRPDIATANPNTASISVFRNTGATPLSAVSFTPAVNLPGPYHPHFIKAVDLDADGRKELLVSSYLGASVTVYHNQASPGALGGDSFAPGISYGLAGRGHTISFGDLNGDGKLDVVVDTEIGDSIAIFQNQSAAGDFTTNSLAPRVDLIAGWNAWGASVGDLDGDGRPDIVFANTYDDILSIYHNVSTLSNRFEYPPEISQQPTSLVVNAGQNASFEVVVTGNPPPTYQWYFSQRPLADQTNATLSLNNVPPALAGEYFVVAANSLGASTSSVVTLTVLTFPPTIRSQPQDSVVAIGNPAGFTVQAGGTAPFQYLWSKDGSIIGNATNATLTLLNVQTNDAGFYSVSISNLYGAITSRSAELIVVPAPVCTTPPPGIVSWWPGETNLLDIVGAHDATLYPPPVPPSLVYTNGKVGTAFSCLPGVTKWFTVNPTPELNLGAGAFTFEAWVFRQPSAKGGICGWGGNAPNQVTTTPGVRLVMESDDSLTAWLIRTPNQIPIFLRTPAGAVPTNRWDHLAFSGDALTGDFALYVNGVAVAQTNIGPAALLTSGFFSFGSAAGQPLFGALLDEPALYNRALSVTEIRSIFTADSAGKCTPSPIACVTPPAGIVGWWRGESNTVDIAAGNDASLIPTNLPTSYYYQTGQIGAAFTFRGPNCLVVPHSDNLNVGTESGLTVEGWIYPGQLSPMPVVEWTDTNSYGVNLWLSPSRGPTVLEANLIDAAGGFHLIRTPTQTIRGYSWQHVALTYDKASGIAALYSDGNLVTTTNLGSFTPQTRTDLLIGFHPHATISSGDGSPPLSDYRFIGAMDELAIYRRALSAGEMRNLSRPRPGKCLELPPAISRQPTDQLGIEGGTNVFGVTASGTAPLYYQWFFNDATISDATNATVSLHGIPLSSAGAYSVLVSNIFGVVTSRVAQLTVLPAGQCLPTPWGAVGFWRGESNTVDALGLHPAAWGTNTPAAYSGAQNPGIVGTAFQFNGYNYLMVPADPDLNVGAGGGFTVEGWIKTEVLGGINPLWDWNDGRANVGVGLMLGRTGPGSLEVTLTDTNVISTDRTITLTTTNNLFTLTDRTQSGWAHVALAVDKAARSLQLFVNGHLVGERNLPLVTTYASQGNKVVFSPATTGNLYFGYRPSGIYGGSRYRGLMDEVTVYYRALTPLEIQAIYLVGSSGKCSPTTLACQPLQEGIVSWWRGESNVLDSVDGNHGLTTQVPPPNYTNGVVGAAFLTTGARNVRVPASPSLNVGLGSGFTFETWFKLNTLSPYALAAWYTNSATPCAYFGSSPTRGPSYFEANLVDTAGSNHAAQVYATATSGGPPLINVGQWQHLVVTYDKPTGNAVIYFNGAPTVVTNLGIFTPRTIGDLSLGYRLQGNYPGSGYSLNGAMDETSLYARALTSGEVTANYRNYANRCMLPPVIVQSPANVRVNPGSNVTFAVVAEGNPILRYQWGRGSYYSPPSANNPPLPGQTNPSVTLTNVQARDGGRYWIRVTNAFGVAVASNINLTINNAPRTSSGPVHTMEDTPVNVTLGGVDLDHDPLAFVVTELPQHGSLVGSESNYLFTPAPNFFGEDSFVYKVSDGLAESAPALVRLTVTPVNDPPVAFSQILATDEDVPLALTLGASDVDGDALTFDVTPPAHGTLSGTAPNLVYTPNPNYFGEDVFTFTARDSSNAVSPLAAISITVRPVNDAPVPRIEITPLDQLPGVTNLVCIAPVCCTATLRLDASQSTDVENDPLTYVWLAGTNVLSTEVMFTNRFAPGTHEITLVVSDGAATTIATRTVEIITAAEAVAFLQQLTEAGVTEPRLRGPLLAWLRQANESFARCRPELGVAFLELFVRRVEDRLRAHDPALAESLIQTAAAIIEAAPDCESRRHWGRHEKRNEHNDVRGDRGAAAPGRSQTIPVTNPTEETTPAAVRASRTEATIERSSPGLR